MCHERYDSSCGYSDTVECWEAEKAHHKIWHAQGYLEGVLQAVYTGNIEMLHEKLEHLCHELDVKFSNREIMLTSSKVVKIPNILEVEHADLAS